MFVEETYNYQNGKLLNSISRTIRHNSTDEITTNFLYDINGVLVSEEKTDGTGNKFIYDNKGVLSEQIYINPTHYKSNSTKYYYSKNHTLDSTVSSSVYNSDRTSSSVTHYTDDVIVFSKSIYDGEVSSIHRYEYNDNGDKIHWVTEIYGEGDDIIRNYEYKYDPWGNWIEMRLSQNDGETEVTNRTLFYKGEDDSHYRSEFELIKSNLLSSHQQYDNRSNYQRSSPDNSYRRSNTPEYRWVSCPSCQGTGLNRCQKCGGQGIVKCDQCNGRGTNYSHGREETCYICNGRGTRVCQKCNGKGNTGSCYKCGGSGRVKEYY